MNWRDESVVRLLNPSPARLTLIIVKHRATFLVLIISLSVSGGCDMAQPKGGAQLMSADVGATEWPFAPAAMRIHPFTQITVDAETGSPMLDAHIELLDQAGDVTKGIGTLRFELVSVSDRASASAVNDRRIEMWDVALETLDDNLQHFDRITRTYGFKLKLNAPPDNKARLRLHAQFTKPTGNRLTAEMLVKSSKRTNPAPTESANDN
ncbi:MAG: hypothetical protein CMJ49_13250 [Planctomycetaceae bacterium]|nr:hypothetical protein [Planctomycetaceae bacterium]